MGDTREEGGGGGNEGMMGARERCVEDAAYGARGCVYTVFASGVLHIRHMKQPYICVESAASGTRGWVYTVCFFGLAYTP